MHEWLTKHPRFSMHITPTSASWLNMVERSVSVLTCRRPSRWWTARPAVDKHLAMAMPGLKCKIDEIKFL